MISPGLQAVRDRAERAARKNWSDFNAPQAYRLACTDVPALLDLIETLAGVIEGVALGRYGHWSVDLTHDARAALDKYREFGE